MKQDEAALRAKIALLSEEAKIDLIIELMARVESLTARVAELEARLGMNSSNSSRPPSSDGYRKPAPKSLREVTGRKPGGQKGHPGKNLRQVPEPDEVVEHSPSRCVCGCCLDAVGVERAERRQVFELPKRPLWVTEHRIASKKCPQCGRMVRAQAPAEAPGPAQYGPRLLAVLVYLRDYQLLPYGRLTALCRDLFGAGVCKRTVETAQTRVHGALAPFEDMLRARLLGENVLHADETGMRVAGKLHWMHSLSSPGLTLYQAHPRRGVEAIEANGVIPAFTGTLVHDCWAAYFQYGAGHALCGTHLLRELQGVQENEGHAWAREMSAVLRAVSKTTDGRDDAPLSPAAADWFAGVYDDILARGRRELPPPRKTPGKRGRPANAKSANLHARLDAHRDAALRCLREPGVPFTNNLAERDIRMVKLRQKTSGCARTLTGAQVFARLRSYISTALKQGRNPLECLVEAVRGQPWTPHAQISSV
ncbi:MAG: IS66 family transposase [Candidatus Hydrogenedens sp.]|nr:IS66 family transposase [Candidatus Hydrogenedens sp.]